MPDTLQHHSFALLRSLGGLIALTIALCAAPVVWASTEGYLTEQKTNDITMPAATVDDSGRIFLPSRLFTSRDGKADSRTLVERAYSADPNFTESKKLAGKAQELLLRANSQQRNDQLTGSFADFVKSSVGNALPIFGYDLFTQNDRFGLNVDPATVPVDYQVGPGDEIIVKAWGQIDINFQGKIDRTGSIFLPRVGNVVLSGQRVEDLLPLITQTVAEKYRNFELTVTLGELRQIQYYVLGMANVPGVHTTDATATTLHALLVSGGPSVLGDLRAIELRRGGQTVAVIDAYDLIVNGDRRSDPRLQSGDIIYIPPAKGFVAIDGDIKKSAIFHLKKGMTFGDVLKLTGGFNLKQAEPNIRLERVIDNQRHVEFFHYTPSMNQMPLQDGDILLISPVSPKIEQAVTLRGNVAEPLRKPWIVGMRVSDLIGSTDQLIRRAVWTDRNNRTSFNLLDHLNADARFKDNFTDINWSYATVERIDPITLQTHLITFELDKALAGDPKHNLVLEDGDSVVIYSTKDFHQPAYKELQLVKVDGEVNRPGTYVMQPNQTILDVIEKAGGMTDQAFLYGLVLSRERVRQQEAKMIGLAADKVEEDFHRYIASRATNSVTQNDKDLDFVELEATKRLITRLRSIPTQGRVVLNLPDPYSVKNYINNIKIEDQDYIHIPAYTPTVTVAGAVFQQTTVMWQAGKKPRDYIKLSGGMKKVADIPTRILVMRADGSIWQDDFRFWQARPPINVGDTVFVQEEVPKQSDQKILGDWSQILYQLGIGALAVNSLIGW